MPVPSTEVRPSSVPVWSSTTGWPSPVWIPLPPSSALSSPSSSLARVWVPRPSTPPTRTPWSSPSTRRSFCLSNHHKRTFSVSSASHSNLHALLRSVHGLRLGCARHAQCAHATGKTGPHATDGHLTEWCERNLLRRERGKGRVDMGVVDIVHTCVLDTLFEIRQKAGFDLLLRSLHIFDFYDLSHCIIPSFSLSDLTDVLSSCRHSKS